MRARPRTDLNQPELVAQLRALGVSVAITSAVGAGFPDLVLGYRGQNLLVEVKDPRKPPSKRKLTPDELAWHTAWQGTAIVAETLQDCLAALGLQAQHPR